MWEKIPLKDEELQLHGTLNGGQSFRWWHDKTSDEWTGVYSRTVWKLKQYDHQLHYKILGTLHKTNSTDDKAAFRKLLEIYFRLNVNLNDLYKEWSSKDELFRHASQSFYGIRMLNQEAVENLFSFICSQNNHIKRISSIVEKMCSKYGDKICTVDGRPFYAFPTVQQMVHTEIESELRQLGLGYRAEYIKCAAAYITQQGGEGWFDRLVDMEYPEAKNELLKIKGIGPKVADCICLMSLNHMEAIPVDTHVYQIAAQNYLPHMKGKTNVTKTMYADIGDHFRSLFGEKAGWAQTVLFCADLKNLQHKDDDTKENEKKLKKTNKVIVVSSEKIPEINVKDRIKRKAFKEEVSKLEFDLPDNDSKTQIKQEINKTDNKRRIKIKVEALEPDIDASDYNMESEIDIRKQEIKAEIKLETVESEHDEAGDTVKLKVKTTDEIVSKKRRLRRR